MRIAVVCPVEETIPPRKYGGVEWIAYHVAHGLAQRGHQVDLYATGDSKPDDYTLVPITPKDIRLDPAAANDPALREARKMLAVSQAAALLDQRKYDVIHNHVRWRLLLFQPQLHASAVVTTLHMPLSAPNEAAIFQRYRDLPYVSISNNQRRDLPDLRFAKTIYNGVDTEEFTFSADGGDYLAFLARLSPQKGAIPAAIVAAKTRHPLKVAAKIDYVDRAYAEEFKATADRKYVELLGEIGSEERTTLLTGARGLLAPIQWEEPFGLMFTEAMASGTPVIAYARGSAPEIIEDGVTGFLVNQSKDLTRGSYLTKRTGLAGLEDAVRRLYALPPAEYRAMRRAARQRVERKFSVTMMVDQYERLFHRLS
jgi:glycosyltransferase involved in cell wall biosynthesis